jgi:hypothetical protein
MRLYSQILMVSSLAGVVPLFGAQTVTDFRGNEFVAIHQLENFSRTEDEKSEETVLLSPEVRTRITWRELVVSWNADMPEKAGLRVEARPISNGGTTKFYQLGHWSVDPSEFPRESVPGQVDADAQVATDTLILNRASDRVQFRLTLRGPNRSRVRLKFLGICVTDPDAALEPLPPEKRAWGKVLAVPEKTQMIYPNGNVLCSPTTLSMLLDFWSIQLGRPELKKDVPEVEKAIYDAKWHGTGNWVFNTAYAGSLSGIRGYVTRFSDVAELEAWVSKGLPVGLSLCYNRLRGKGREPSGHLVVCVGFTETGDVILNDPGTRYNVRKTFPRKNLIDAWAYSKNAVYLVYPEDTDLPEDRFGHWDSRKTARFGGEK